MALRDISFTKSARYTRTDDEHRPAMISTTIKQ
jgi:hypothetical protein